MTRLWTAFVLGWLLVLLVSSAWLTIQPLTGPRLAAVLLIDGVLAVLYLWATLRSAIGPADLTPAGPPPAVIRTRLLQMIAMSATVAAGVLVAPNAECYWLSMYVIIAAGLALPPRLASAVTAVMVIASLIASQLVGRFDMMLLILIPFGAAAIVVRSLTINVEQLRAAREELARAAVDQERVRFSRDLHDILGHTLSVIILKSELAGRLLPASPSQAATELGDIERSARDAQRQVRAAVMGYRQPELRRELAGARELLSAAGIEASVGEAIVGLPGPLDGLLAWTVREGVTNVIRHSRARRCVIDLTRTADAIRLMVTDDGQLSNGAPNAGSGLRGLGERATAFGAVFEAGPQSEGGFKLVMTAPLGRSAA